jgi:hypothetical protein
MGRTSARGAAGGRTGPSARRQARAPVAVAAPSNQVRALHPGRVSAATSEQPPLTPTEPEWSDGEDVYPIYRPTDDEAESTA